MRVATALSIFLLMATAPSLAHASKGSPHTPSMHIASSHTSTPHTPAAHTSAPHTPTVHTPEPHGPVTIHDPLRPKDPSPPSPRPPSPRPPGKEPRPGPVHAPQPGPKPIAHLPHVPAIHPSAPVFIAHSAMPAVIAPVTSIILVTGTGTALNDMEEEFAESQATNSAEQSANVSCIVSYRGTPIGVASTVVSGCSMLSVAPFSCQATATVLCQVTQS